MIRKGSPYYYPGDSSNPQNVEGTIVVNDGRAAYCYKVNWDNGTNNAYRVGDLDLISAPDAKFKVGDKVKVTKRGNTYSSYTDMFALLGFKNLERNDAFNDGTLAEVVAMTYHERIDEGVLYHIKTLDGKKESLIGKKGISKAETVGPTTVEVDKAFIIEAWEAADATMKAKIEEKFPDAFKPQKGDLYKFSRGQKIDTYFNDMPFMIGQHVVSEGLCMRSLIVLSEYEVELSRTGSHQVISFRKKH